MHTSDVDSDLPPARRGITLCNEARAPLSLRLCLPDGREVPLDRRIVIGSAPGSDVELRDPHVSGAHCLIFLDGKRTRIRDCGSANGTFLGALRIESGELRPGVSLMVGRTPLRVVAEGTRESAASAMVGESPAIERLKQQIERVAGARASVLLLGESGAGKELAALAVHQASGRAGRFVPVNCAALSSELAESELFGHERGAFTGAVAKKLGLFEQADGGTLFFDEIAELPLLLQPKLLRALETRHVRPVGGSGERPVDVRVVAATHQDLAACVERGTFRRDLYHRLSTIELRLPALRERASDIPLLAAHFLDEMACEHGHRTLSAHALERLAAHPWRGNIRELKNALQHAAIFSASALIEPDDLPLATPRPSAHARPTPFHGEHALSSDMSATPRASGTSSGAPGTCDFPTPALRNPSAHERETILEALRLHGTNRKAAEALRMPKSTFSDKIRRYRTTPSA